MLHQQAAEAVMFYYVSFGWIKPIHGVIPAFITSGQVELVFQNGTKKLE